MRATCRLVAVLLALVISAPNLAGTDPHPPWAKTFHDAWIHAVADPEGVVPYVRLHSRLVAMVSARDAAALTTPAAAYMARRIYLSPERLPDDDGLGIVEHLVQPGERLETIAKRQHMTASWVAALNPQASPSALRAGQRLKLVDVASVPIQVVISVEHFRLMLWRGGVLIAAFEVGLGSHERPTPRGETTIKVRVSDPEWRDPATGTVHRPGSPGNILGGWWLGFAPGADGRFASIGMHGYTGAPTADWLSKPGSRGCVRLRQQDLAVVAAMLLPGTRVSVR